VPTVSEPRAYLDDLIRQRREDYASLSRLLGRNPAYIQQFIKRGTPKRLSEEDRRKLARYFGVSEALLGGPATGEGEPLKKIARLDVRASAGPGAFAGQEATSEAMGFSDRMLRSLAGGDPSGLSLISVAGDSMEPTLSDGDDILVNRLDGFPRLRDGIYVLRLGDALHVKRIACGPDASRITLVSDNETYPPWANIDAKAVKVIGRVVWGGRRFR
jgi:phage repressor protein C with HTH and peptisase S24 domain